MSKDEASIGETLFETAGVEEVMLFDAVVGDLVVVYDNTAFFLHSVLHSFTSSFF